MTIAEQDDVRLTTNIVNCEPADVTIGMPVRVVFEQREDVWLPLFEPEPRRPMRSGQSDATARVATQASEGLRGEPDVAG